MEIITMLIVGLVAGVLASTLVHGSGFGLLGDIVLGVAGAFIGGWGFQRLGWHAPLSGIFGVIVIAFCGALVLLLVLRLFKRTTATR
jgi:uncharacterized membrane protein YeaQ/YmgE (transglycosylase-associated protein family)